MEFNFEHGKVYYYDYGSGYIIRFNKMDGNTITILSSLALLSGEISINQNNWSSDDLTGPETREATQEEIAKLEKAENYKYKPNYEIY